MVITSFNVAEKPFGTNIIEIRSGQFYDLNKSNKRKNKPGTILLVIRRIALRKASTQSLNSSSTEEEHPLCLRRSIFYFFPLVLTLSAQLLDKPSQVKMSLMFYITFQENLQPLKRLPGKDTA